MFRKRYQNSRTYLLVLCAVLALTVGCTGNETSDNEEVKATWQRYNDAYRAKDLNRALSILDSMETEKIIRTPEADYKRGLVYDQGWQMKIAEHFYKKAYEGYASDPSQDWYTYADAGYRWACLRFGRGDTGGALSVITDLLHRRCPERHHRPAASGRRQRGVPQTGRGCFDDAHGGCPAAVAPVRRG